MKKVKKFIMRRSLIYKTKVEYGDYTMNHIQGCSHGCKYPCYAYLLKKRFGVIKSYEEWCEPAIVENTLELLDKELPRFKEKIQMLHLCFTTDPFMYGYDEISDLSIAAIKKCNSYEIPCSVLTKGVLPKELIYCSNKNEYGITLVSLSESFRNLMEPNSAPYKERINALKYLHNQGFKTWISIEPYPTPNIIIQDINEILNEVKFVDKIIFGKMNYSSRVTEYKSNNEFYNEMSLKVIEWCNKNNKSYYIKNGTFTL